MAVLYRYILHFLVSISVKLIMQSRIIAFDNLTRNIWVIGGYFHDDKVYTYNIDTDIISDVTMSYNASSKTVSRNYVSGATALVIDRTIYYSSTYALKSLNIDTYAFVDNVLSYIARLTQRFGDPDFWALFGRDR
eukprot:358733_1